VTDSSGENGAALHSKTVISPKRWAVYCQICGKQGTQRCRFVDTDKISIGIEMKNPRSMIFSFELRSKEYTFTLTFIVGPN
jgi:hypothetical protein